MIIFKMVLPTKRIFSENTLYRPGIGFAAGGKKYPYLYLDPLFVKFKEQISKHIIENECVLSEDKPLHLMNMWIFKIVDAPKQPVCVRDTTNMVKAIEDEVYKNLGINDSKVDISISCKIYDHTKDFKNKIKQALQMALDNIDNMQINKNSQEEEVECNVLNITSIFTE